MAEDSAHVEGRNGGGSGKPPERPTTTHAQAAYSHALVARGYAHAMAFVSLAVKGSGLLALLVSTVILLGGFVSALEKMDFFCITVITMIQAAGIFKEWERCLEYVLSFLDTFVPLTAKALDMRMNFLKMGKWMDFLTSSLSALVLGLPCMVVAWCTEVIYGFGPFACAAISSWRMKKLSQGNNRDGTDSTADMMAALNIFYSLIIFQGVVLVLLLASTVIYEEIVANGLRSLEQLPDRWGKLAIHMYLYDIIAKCRKDPVSTKGWDLIKYGAWLLDSESQEDYLDGARLLSAYITKGENVRSLLLPSSHKIQKLIESLWISSGSLVDENNREIRELAAKIVADLAGHIDVARYPGAMRCISSLLLQVETTRTYRCISDPQRRPMGPLTKGKQGKGVLTRILEQLVERVRRQYRLTRDRDLKRPGISEEQRQQKREGGTSNELILQGLIILERLASNNDDNRRIICSAPRLLPKITAPLYSATLIEDVKTKAWADIVTRCLKVLYQLIHAPGRPSRRLRRQIFSNVQALSNLKSILELGSNEADHQELQLVAMEILTELALDLSTNLTEEIKKVLITKQLQLFLLANGDGAAIAGRTLVSLSTNSESNSALVMTTQNGIIGRLTRILVLDDENITRRTIAAEIMVNLCPHCNIDYTMKEILLPKVLREIMSIKIKSQQIKASADQNNPALADEENQGNSVSTKNTEERHNISTKGDTTEIEEVSDEEREAQEAFLSLAQVICNKLNSADLDGAIQNAVQNENNARTEEQRREAFVDKLKTIIDENRHPAVESLRIVKLCGQIAKSVMRCEQYVEIFRNKGFKSSLSEASKTMFELESCMLFVGTDFGLRKTVRPLFSEIEKTWSEM